MVARILDRKRETKVTYGKTYKPPFRCGAPSAFPLNAEHPYCRRNVRWEGDHCWQHREGYVPTTRAARTTTWFQPFIDAADEEQAKLLIDLRTRILEMLEKTV